MHLPLRFRLIGPVVVVLAALLAVATRAQDAPSPADTVPETGQNVPEDPKLEIDRLIEQLGDEGFAVRERAQTRLARIGFEACDALRIAEDHEDLEIAARARYLLHLMQVRWSEPDDPAEVKQVLDAYPASLPDERVGLMRKLTNLPGGAGLPAICRLVRYEKSTRLSKQAAIEMLNRVPLHESGRRRLTVAVDKHLANSGRTAAVWLLKYARLLDAPADTLDDWRRLVKEEADVLARFPAQTTPTILASLLYHQAEAETGLGQTEAAEATAARARQTLAVGQEGSFRMALSLRHRGLFDWAEAEYRHAANTGPLSNAVSAFQYLAEMLHDGGNDLRAAEALGEARKLVKKANLQHLAQSGIRLSQLAGRMNYFYSCHWLRQGDLSKQRIYLDAAIKNDPMELDAMIARYRLVGLAPDEHRKTIRMIEKAVAKLRQNIATSAEPIADCNQLAWLVGNTEGDLDEALKCARRAVAKYPQAAAYLDTLARVEYARGDCESALENQRKAVAMDPHSGLIARQLELFSRAAESGQDGSNTHPEDNPPGEPEPSSDKKPQEPKP